MESANIFRECGAKLQTQPRHAWQHGPRLCNASSAALAWANLRHPRGVGLALLVAALLRPHAVADLKRETHRVGPSCARWARRLTETPDQRPETPHLDDPVALGLEGGFLRGRRLALRI